MDFFGQIGRGSVELEELFVAYFECRKNKRGTANAIAFEADYENRLIELWQEINVGSYEPGRSIAFMVTEPVQREVFAADFRDRIVHHLIINKLNHLFEERFIEDSYSCREGKGTLYGINRISEFIKKCSDNYSKDCFILKMDIQSFFMSIDKKILFEELKKFVLTKYEGEDKLLLIELIEKIIFNSPEKNCFIKGKKSDWIGLPASKSLFSVAKGKGLPIGNLTSQVFANFYLDFFDKYVKQDCGIKYYGRYVDDFVIVHEDKNYLIKLQEQLKAFMAAKLTLRIHPRKIYLQHYSKGVKFIGAVVKPNREYIGNRTKGNMYAKIAEFNSQLKNNPENAKAILQDLVPSLNSYLGFMIHYKSYNIRKKMLEKKLAPEWKKYVIIDPEMNKVSPKEKYKPQQIKIAKIKRRRRYRKKQALLVA